MSLRSVHAAPIKPVLCRVQIQAEEELSDQMDRIGQEMQARKQQLMGQMQGMMR